MKYANEIPSVVTEARRSGVSFPSAMQDEWRNVPFNHTKIYDSGGEVTEIYFFHKAGSLSETLGGIKIPRDMVLEGYVPCGHGEEFLVAGAQDELGKTFDQARGFDHEEWKNKAEDLTDQKAIWKRMAKSKISGLWSQNLVVFIDHKNPKYSELTERKNGYYGFQRVGRMYHPGLGVKKISSINDLRKLQGPTGLFVVTFWNGEVGFGCQNCTEAFEGTLGGVQAKWSRRPGDGIRESFSYAHVKIWYHEGIEGVPSALARERLPIEPIVLYPQR